MTEINYNDKIAYIERQKMLKVHREAVVTAYDLTRDERPEDTVAMLVKLLGHKEAMIAIAECVNAVSYDGRIYDDTAVWAAKVEGAASSKELDERHLYALSEIHPTHMNQIGGAAMKACWKEEEKAKPLAKKLADFADDYDPYEFMGDQELLDELCENNIEALVEHDGTIEEWLEEIAGYAADSEDEETLQTVKGLLEEVREFYGISD